MALIVGIIILKRRNENAYARLYFSLSDRLRDLEVQRMAESETAYKEYKENIEAVKEEHKETILNMTKEEEAKYDELYSDPDKLDEYLIGIAKGR